MTYSIYYLTHPITREIRYVGLTNDPERRLKQHLYDSINRNKKNPVNNWIRKLSKQDLEPVMKVIKSGLTKEEAEQEEIETIARYRKLSNRLLNILAGGNLSSAGVPHSEEARKKISEAVKNRFSSEEARKKLSEANKGKTLSEETRKKVSKANKGKTLSEETRKKVSEAVKNRFSSEEARKKTSESLKGRGTKTYTFLYNGNKVIIHNLFQFCKENGLSTSGMRNILSGRQKSHKGYTRYIEEK